MNFLKRLCGDGCAHRFSWPRTDTAGNQYQTCLLCGTAYEYDWAAMRRTGRLALPPRSVNVLAISARQQQFPASSKAPITRPGS